MRILIKLLCLPILMILTVMKLLLNGISKVYCLAAGIVINISVICALLALITQNWLMLAILASKFALIVGLLLGMGTLIATMDSIKDKLLRC